MGFLSKVWGKVKKFHKKVFKAFTPGLKKIWANKVGRALIIGGALIAGGWALMAATPLAGALGTAGAAAGATGQAAASTLGGSVGSSLSQAAAAGAVTAPGAAAIAAPTATSILGSVGSGLSGAAGAVGSGISAAVASPYAPAAMLVGGQMLSGAMQAKEEQKQIDQQRQQKIDDRNGRSAFGLTYDGQTDANIDSGGQLAALNQRYYQQGQQNILGANNAPVAPAPTPRNRTRFNPQTNQWEVA